MPKASAGTEGPPSPKGGEESKGEVGDVEDGLLEPLLGRDVGEHAGVTTAGVDVDAETEQPKEEEEKPAVPPVGFFELFFFADKVWMCPPLCNRPAVPLRRSILCTHILIRQMLHTTLTLTSRLWFSSYHSTRCIVDCIRCPLCAVLMQPYFGARAGIDAPSRYNRHHSPAKGISRVHCAS